MKKFEEVPDNPAEEIKLEQNVNNPGAGASIYLESEDAVLVQKAKSGESEAFGILVRRYQNELFSLALGLVSSADEAQDLTAEAFVRAWQHIKDFRQQASFKTWLWRILINLARTYMRRKYIAKRIFFWKKTVLDEEEDLEPQWVDTYPGNDPQKHSEHKSMEAAVNLCREKLSAREKEVFALKFDQSLKISEISSLLSLSQNTVKAFLFRASKKMAQQLNDYKK